MVQAISLDQIIKYVSQLNLFIEKDLLSNLSIKRNMKIPMM